MKRFALAGAFAVTLAAPARAQTAADTPSPVLDTPAGKLTFGGYAEVFYAYNFNRPANRVTAMRGFDDRHDTFALSNAALSLGWDKGPVAAKVTVQAGQTPDAYARGAGALKHVQEVWLSYAAPVGHGLRLQVGIFASPKGPESIAVRDDWTWSRSSAFYLLPIYHAGARVAYAIDERWSTTFAIYNGWNSVVDQNADKSLAWSLRYELSQTLKLELLYLGGVERPWSAPEVSGWRHLGDAQAVWQATPALAFAAHADAGFEVTRFGDHGWAAGALTMRARLAEPFYVAVRSDVFREGGASTAAGASSPIFMTADWIASGTATLDLRPHENISFRLEVRHDVAASPLFFRYDTPADVPTTRRQTTALLGAVAWF